MIRISNRNHDEKEIAGPQVHYIDKVIEVPVERIVQVPSEPTIQFMDREVHKHIEVPVERIVERIIEVPVMVDLEPLQEKDRELEQKIHKLMETSKQLRRIAMDELEMQRRALVAIKAQRDIDRSRRLMLIRRMKKEQTKHKQTELKFKLAIGASLLLTLVSFFVKL